MNFKGTESEVVDSIQLAQVRDWGRALMIVAASVGFHKRRAISCLLTDLASQNEVSV
jgi:hypothetical protein